MKKTLYIILTTLLGLLLSFIVHALVEVFYINNSLTNGTEVRGTNFLGFGWCALPAWAQYTLPVLGIIGGYFLGQYWWRVVYVDKRHWWFRRQQRQKAKG